MPDIVHALHTAAVDVALASRGVPHLQALDLEMALVLQRPVQALQFPCDSLTAERKADGMRRDSLEPNTSSRHPYCASKWSSLAFVGMLAHHQFQ